MRDSDRDREEPSRRAGRGARFVAAFAVAGVAAAALAWPAVPEGAEARFVALALIGLAVGVGVVRRIARAPLSRTLGHAGVWLLVAALAAVGYGFRDEARYVFDRVRGDLAPEKGYGATAGEIAFRASPNGHFLVEALVDGVPLVLVVDTGASDVVLSRGDARALGVDPDALDYTRAYETANGVVMGAPVTLGEVRVGPVRLERVRASVNDAPMARSLLGMSFLGRTGGYAVRGDTLTLYAPE